MDEQDDGKKVNENRTSMVELERMKYVILDANRWTLLLFDILQNYVSSNVRNLNRKKKLVDFHKYCIVGDRLCHRLDSR